MQAFCNTRSAFHMEKTDTKGRFCKCRGKEGRSILKKHVIGKYKNFQTIVGEMFLKTNLFVSNLVTFLSSFNKILFMHQIVLNFDVAF